MPLNAYAMCGLATAECRQTCSHLFHVLSSRSNISICLHNLLLELKSNKKSHLLISVYFSVIKDLLIDEASHQNIYFTFGRYLSQQPHDVVGKHSTEEFNFV